VQPAETSSREPAPDAHSAIAATDRLLHGGEPLLAFNAAQEGLRQWPGNLRLHQLQALALARSGDAERANALLAKLAAEGSADGETLGMLARTHKDLASRAHGAEERARHLRAAFGLYERGLEAAQRSHAHAEAYYAGINAAAMAILLDDSARGRSLAREVRAACALAVGGESDAISAYWKEATLGEAALILGEAEVAASHYGRAAKLAGRRFGDLGTTRRQARLLIDHLRGDRRAIEALTIPPVVVFAGHMIDAPDRESPRFPAAAEPAVRDALRARLAALAPVAAYGSAASGSDILCLEIARELGAETHIVLPFPAPDFRRASVDAAGGDWGERFECALAAADSVTVASDHRASGSVATFEYANLLLTGMGRLRAQMLDTSLACVAAWDPAVPGAPGGTASIVSLWNSSGLAVEHVRVGELRPASADRPAVAPVTSSAPSAAPLSRHELKAMLFADAVGYSQLSEDQIPLYIHGFLGAVAGLNRRTQHRFEHVETAGDGLYMVFADPRDAGHYAVELSELARSFDREACGLPANFNLRIALHCGPVHCGRDPITGLPQYTGPHTSRTARIEPITPPGQVYASSAFAAVAAAKGVDDLALDYVGRIPLAKSHGTLGLYCVHRLAAPAQA
jgi:hypothetical protein